jgi:hypothetical protein
MAEPRHARMRASPLKEKARHCGEAVPGRIFQGSSPTTEKTNARSTVGTQIL